MLAGMSADLVRLSAASPRGRSSTATHTSEAAVDTWFNSSIAGLDTAAISAGVTPTFFIFEDTLRLDRAGFVGYVAQQIASMPGPFTLRYALSEWDTRIEGDVAWTSFRNRGVLTPSQGDPTSFEWLDTAILMRVDGSWLIERYHSAPVRRAAP
jgi:hypothetical protein